MNIVLLLLSFIPTLITPSTAIHFALAVVIGTVVGLPLHCRP